MAEYNNGVLSEQQIFNQIPTGYRFKPLDCELVVHYLSNKVSKNALPPNMILDKDVYKYNPQDLHGMEPNYGEDDRYFFSSRNRKYANGNRPSRSTPGGFWKATGADKSVTYKGIEVGVKKTLVFQRRLPIMTEGGKPKHKKTDWIMQEYRLTGRKPRQRNGIRDMKLDEWVLCKIYEHKRACKDRNKTQKETPANKARVKSGKKATPVNNALVESGGQKATPVDNALVKYCQKVTPVNNALVEYVQNQNPVAMHQYAPPPVWNHHQQFATHPMPLACASFMHNAEVKGFSENFTQEYHHPPLNFNELNQMFAHSQQVDNSFSIGNSIEERALETCTKDDHNMFDTDVVSEYFSGPEQFCSPCSL